MDSYSTIANLAYQTFRIPVYLYKSGVLTLSVPAQDKICHPPVHIADKILGQESLTYITDYHICFCKLPCMSNPDFAFVLGPISSLPYSTKALGELHRDYVVPTEKRELFDEFFSHIPTMTYIDFFHILRIVYYMINSNEITLDSFLKEIYMGASPDSQSLRIEHTASLYQQREADVQNNSYEIEKLILTFVENGDMEGMKNFISNVPQYHAGTVAADVLRMQKNYFISTYTLATRTAIKAGFPTADAYQLSDLYISRLELLNSMNAVNQLFANAMLDITALVQKHRDSLQTQFLNDLGIPVRECILYVQQHTNQNLSVQSVADALGYQRTYLSAYFSKTMGFHLSDYIYRCKLEEAKTLLTYTDKDISEISSYLCFSSQSHFQLRFKKAFHMTPAQYRRMNSQKQ
jgi:AraC-type DNA-binding domain-containing proteins